MLYVTWVERTHTQSLFIYNTHSFMHNPTLLHLIDVNHRKYRTEQLRRSRHVILAGKLYTYRSGFEVELMTQVSLSSSKTNKGKDGKENVRIKSVPDSAQVFLTIFTLTGVFGASRLSGAAP